MVKAESGTSRQALTGLAPVCGNGSWYVYSLTDFAYFLERKLSMPSAISSLSYMLVLHTRPVFPPTMLFILFCLSSSLAMVDSFLACWLFFVLRYLVTVQLYHVSHAQLRDTSITNYPPISIHTVLSFLSSCLYSIIFDLLH